MLVQDAESDPKAINLRLELKVWEKAFAAAHDGRKPKRVDIQNDATISAKYEEYDRLYRRPSLAKRTPQKSKSKDRRREESQVLRDRPPNTTSATPQKPAKYIELVQHDDSQQQQQQPTPAHIRLALGPTPQKDGQVLGIFDSLASNPTPTKDNLRDSTSIPPAHIIGTPSKPCVSGSFASSDHAKMSRTPQSSGKRHWLDAFAGTPIGQRRDSQSRERDLFTPSSAAKRQDRTPTFLRRCAAVTKPLSRIEEAEEEGILLPPPFKKRGLVRSLSSIIQGLRKQEEQRMDDDWEILREIEAEQEEGGGGGEKMKAGNVMVEDSQAVEMPLGPDRGAESSDAESVDDVGGLDANGKPRKVWKKKGLKRQTRRVIMRPVVHQPQKASGVGRSDDEESESETRRKKQGRRQVDGSKEGVDVEDDDEAVGVGETTTHESRTGTSKTTGKSTKKVNAQAHMNFRRLNIKNKNSKANGRGRKFGRR